MKNGKSSKKEESKASVSGKVFVHNKELDKQYVDGPFNTFSFDERFYKVDKDDLEEVMSREKRLSQAIFQESWSDDMTWKTLSRTLVNISKTLTSNPATKIQVVEIQGQNFATLDGETINLSISSLFDHRVPFFTRLNVCFALGMHEAWHVRYTTPDVQRILYMRGFTKQVISKNGSKLGKVPDLSKISNVFSHPFQMHLSNIIEDKRIERIGLKEYPGYVYYFDEIRKYCTWEHTNFLKDPANKIDYSKDDVLYDMLTKYIMYTYLMPECAPVLAAKEKQPAKFIELTQKVDKILKADVETYNDALTVAAELLKLYPDDQKNKQNDKMSKGSASGPAITKGTPLSSGKPSPLSEKAKKEMGEILSDDLDYAKAENKDINAPDVHDRQYTHVHIKPADASGFDASTYKKSLELSKSITRNLSFLDSRFNRTMEEYEMRSGELDEESLYNISRSREIFYEETPSQGYSMDLGVLIDESGSMHGSKIQAAKEIALALAIALHDSKHINFFCYGHTANTGNHPITMYKYFDSLDRKARNINSLFSVTARSNNADGYAISHMGDVLNKGKSKQKVMIVISDGQPAASGYGGGTGEKHVRQVVTRLEKQGMFVVQIAIDNFRSETMFTHFIPYTGKSLGANLKKVLSKKLVEISNQI